MNIQIFKYIKYLFMWFAISMVVGLAGGIIGGFFHIAVDYATEIREKNSYILLLLPVGAIAITFLYNLTKKSGVLDTNRVINAVTKGESVPFIMAPLIFVSTAISHFVGASVGREGAALQLGGSFGYNIGKCLHLSEEKLKTAIMAGMSAVFAAVFGTPVAAAVFAVEVSTVGKFKVGALFPAVVSAMVSFKTASYMGISPTRFTVPEFENYKQILGVIILTLLCAVVSILFCLTIKGCERSFKKLFKNSYIKAFVGGALLLLFTAFLGTAEYNGAGTEVIARAMTGNALMYAFLLKILFTAISVGSGYKGGEIVPTFFVGSTFGAAIGSFLGINPAFSAAIGFTAVFCGVTNCPIASILLAVEVFGGHSLPVFVLAVIICYIMSGNYSLYSAQKTPYLKIDKA